MLSIIEYKASWNIGRGLKTSRRQKTRSVPTRDTSLAIEICTSKSVGVTRSRLRSIFMSLMHMQYRDGMHHFGKLKTPTEVGTEGGGGNARREAVRLRRITGVIIMAAVSAAAAMVLIAQACRMGARGQYMIVQGVQGHTESIPAVEEWRT